MTIHIEGMHCEACVRRVRAAIERIPNTTIQLVDVGSAELSADVSQLPAILNAIREAGYEPRADT